jgi:hypothetical protein
VVQTYRCAQCGILKQETNHWVIHVWEEVGGAKRLAVYRFHPGLMVDDPSAKPLCGPGCGNKDYQAFVESLR